MRSRRRRADHHDRIEQQRFDPLVKLMLIRPDLGQRELQHLGCLGDFQGREERPSELQRDERPLARVVRERDRLLQVIDAGRRREGRNFRCAQLDQQVGALLAGEWLGQRSFEIGDSDVRRTTCDGRPRGITEHIRRPRLLDRRCGQ